MIPSSPFLQIDDLFNLSSRIAELSWQPFRPGIMIHRLYGDGISGPTAALLHFLETTAVPAHSHDGYEHILVLAGSQRDEWGMLPVGTLRVHSPGSSHNVIAEKGCLVLAIYEKPVRFFENAISEK